MDMLAIITEKVKTIFSSDTLTGFAKKTKLIQRERKITAQDFLFHHLLLGSKNASIADIAEDFFENSQVELTKQAIHKKYKEQAICFLKEVLAELMNCAVAREIPLSTIPFVHRVITTDSSGFKLHHEWAALYPGIRNQKAGLKLQTIMNAVTHKLYSLEVCGARENDQSYKQYIEHIQSKDLSINDLGYFCIDSFKAIHEKEAFFLSRFLKTTGVYCLDKTKFDLEAYLKRTKDTQLDLSLLLGASKLPCRIVAIRLPPEAYQQRLKNVAEKKRKNGHKNKTNASVFEEWTIFVTNLPPSVLPDTLLMLYGLRWQIELFFKVIKTFLNVRDLSVHKNRYKALIILYSSLINVALLTLCSINIVNKEISLYKAAKYFIKYLPNFINLCKADGNPILWIIEKIKRRAIKESRPNRPTAKAELGAAFA